MRGDVAVQVRPATVEDAKGIAAVRARNGMPSFDIEDWRQSWESHPFRDEFAETPFGWVLENGREGIVGTLSNIPMMYDLDGKPVRASASGAWAVDSPHRRSSLLLMSALLRQKGVDLHIIGSANTVASPIMTGLKLPRIPAPDFNVSLLWVTGYRGFATSVLRKKNIPAASWLGMPAGAALGAYDCLKGRVGRRRVEERQYDSFTEDFDIFWNELRRRPAGRLRAARTSAALRWRFRQSLRTGKLAILGLTDSQGALSGYCIALEQQREHIGLKQYLVADLQSLDDAPGTLLELLEAAIDLSRRRGIHLVEWQGGNRAKRYVALSLRPRPYLYPSWPAFYRLFRADLGAALENEATWDLLPIDVY